MTWKRVKSVETGGVIGHWEDDETCSMITLTKGVAHVVHGGQAVAFFTPADLYSDDPGTIGKLVAKRLKVQAPKA